jgi:hypothetical protein
MTRHLDDLLRGGGVKKVGLKKVICLFRYETAGSLNNQFYVYMFEKISLEMKIEVIKTYCILEMKIYYLQIQDFFVLYFDFKLYYTYQLLVRAKFTHCPWAL